MWTRARPDIVPVHAEHTLLKNAPLQYRFCGRPPFVPGIHPVQSARFVIHKLISATAVVLGRTEPHTLKTFGRYGVLISSFRCGKFPRLSGFDAILFREDAFHSRHSNQFLSVPSLWLVIEGQHSMQFNSEG